MLDGVPYRDLFWVYTAGGTIYQCSFTRFCDRLGTYGEAKGVPPRKRRKRPPSKQPQPTEMPKEPMPKFYHFWERNPDSASP